MSTVRDEQVRLATDRIKEAARKIAEALAKMDEAEAARELSKIEAWAGTIRLLLQEG